MIVLHIALNPFGTKSSFIKRKFHPRLKACYPVVLNFQLNTTLHTTVTAMGLNKLVRFIVAIKTSLGRVCLMRTIVFYNFIDRYWEFCHFFYVLIFQFYSQNNGNYLQCNLRSVLQWHYTVRLTLIVNKNPAYGV